MGPIVSAVTRSIDFEVRQGHESPLPLDGYWYCKLFDDPAMLAARRAAVADWSVKVPLTRIPEFLRNRPRRVGLDFVFDGRARA